MNDFIERNIRWLFPLPALIFIVLMMAFPVVYTIWISLTDLSMAQGGQGNFVGLKNYAEMLKDPRFFNAIKLTVYFTALAVGVETVLGVAIALILNREFVGKNLVKTLLLLPMVATPVAIGLAWTLFYEPTIGLGNYALKLLGLPPSKWLASPTAVIPSLALVDIWEWTPMVALIVLAGLAALPNDPYEAALVDGATPFQVFRYVTLPLLTPTILVAVVLRSIDAFKTFDIIYTMTAGGPGFASETLNIYAYNLGFGYFRFGAASSVLVALLALVLGFSILTLWFRKSWEQ
ncbi:carbohydrate ABC transporter permease [Sporolituus thermophilus]|uniref:Multiple sugar transport system permease protein n=1 Tax=Sporolituus thermophilus DSM 23256 TaxID=1123285 RepID=A0A1G7HQ42_9FIRM|nr:sugar ABC transporter permease [Sporolituus thermophilus]SDF02129.1 multiple sugar transport system permease protein [Sporolituus thermophilus DSM 23256]